MIVKNQNTIVFYDGDCPFCNKSVEFVLRHNSSMHIKAAPLNGSTASNLLSDEILKLDTLILSHNKKIYTFSSAAIRTVALSGGIYKIFLALLIFPKSFRDWIYRIIARNRKRLIKTNCDVANGDFNHRI